ncbi:MAG: thiol peroxidase [Cellulophaga sp.]|uniref:thiol peroxidase n=1 Tax=unclassified Cellulophaga TaxID=2634405 RepID=UPI000C2BB8A9|nr:MULTISPECIES: thiol peroxidase [unclassified Cellulophaga]MDO6491035.1 thiol peroxidase [Cellulophaga sp. 2_MG-2023]MDO6493771.1 thiol peroxidase [Cellulophaga sp. 3_MG-2023]PKB44214.1 thiol peroxidase (atypical 2-Cys peroxiredoxin) [Cellulophaga sp. RHA19]
MATVTLKGNKINTLGNLPEVGATAPEFKLTKNDLSTATLENYKGKKVVLNIFPSVDTGTCAQSVRQFNKEASTLENTVVLCISKDLPFAQARFCGAEGLDNVEMLSDFKDGNFGKAYNLSFADGPLEALLSRSIVVLNEEGNVVYTEQVAETTEEPNYKSALEAL